MLDISIKVQENQLKLLRLSANMSLHLKIRPKFADGKDNSHIEAVVPSQA